MTAAVVVRRPRPPGGPRQRWGSRLPLALPPHPKMLIVSEDPNSIRLEVPYAPLGGDNDYSADYVEVDRPGREPLVVRAADPLHRYSVDMIVGYPDGQQSIEDLLKQLRRLSFRRTRMRITYGPSEGGWWRLTRLSWTDERRAHGSNEITRATVSATFTRAVDAVVNPGPIAGGAPAPPPPPKPPAPRTHVVAAGDTYYALAVRYYNDGSKWNRIADANPHPPTAIPVGARLTIP